MFLEMIINSLGYLKTTWFYVFTALVIETAGSHNAIQFLYNNNFVSYSLTKVFKFSLLLVSRWRYLLLIPTMSCGQRFLGHQEKHQVRG